MLRLSVPTNIDNIGNNVATQNADVEQSDVEVLKANHLNNASGNIVTTTKRFTYVEMSRPKTTTPTPKPTTTTTETLAAAASASGVTIENFNSRRRRGRLRPPSSLQKTIEVNANATNKYTLAGIKPNIKKEGAVKLLLLTKLFLLLLLSFLTKFGYVVNNNIVLTAACASKYVALNHIANYFKIIYKLLWQYIYTARTIQCSVYKSNSKRNISNSYYKHSHNACLVYAFILCTSILLPCSTNLVLAAKPKSAQNQLQQEHQQQHQHQQTKHQQHNNNEQLHQRDGYGDLIPVPQEDDVEFLSSQSQEQLFDAEEDEQNSNLSLNEDITSDTFDTHRNGE